MYEGKKLVIVVDVFGFMGNFVMGYCGMVMLKVICVDVVGLMVFVLLCKNLDVVVVLFENKIVKLCFDYWDMVMMNL